MKTEIIEVFNKLDSIQRDHNGRLINANCKTGYAYVHSTWGTDGKRASIQLGCAPQEYHNKASGTVAYGTRSNGYRIEGITGCDVTGRSAVEVAADILADALTDLNSFVKFLETLPCDAETVDPSTVPQLTKRRAIKRVVDIITTNDRLVSDLGRQTLAESHGKDVFLKLADRFGRDTVQNAIDNLTVNEFELRFGL